MAAWAIATFIGGQFLAALFLAIAGQIFPGIQLLNEAVLSSALAFAGYGLALLIAIYIPKSLGFRMPIREELGLKRLVSWGDIGVGVLAVLPYFIISASLVWLATTLLPGINVDQEQSIPFGNITARYEYMLAFVTLVVLAPFAEELFFRGYVLGKMKKFIQPWLAVVLVAAIFGALHLPGEMGPNGMSWQWLVGVDTFALALIMGSLRLWTGSIWAGVILHMAKNAIAFYVLFIYQG